MRRPPFGHRLREFRDPLRSQIPAVGSLMVPFGTSGSEWPLANQPGMPPVMHDGARKQRVGRSRFTIRMESYSRASRSHPILRSIRASFFR